MAAFSGLVLRPAAALLLAGSGCLHAGRGGELPRGAVPLAPPPVFQEWHRRTEECSGLRGDFTALTWYVVPGVSAFRTRRGPEVGAWTRRPGQETIVLAGNFAGHEMVVRHEMLHALIGKAGHPPDLFVTRCRLTWESWRNGRSDFGAEAVRP